MDQKVTAWITWGMMEDGDDFDDWKIKWFWWLVMILMVMDDGLTVCPWKVTGPQKQRIVLQASIFQGMC